MKFLKALLAFRAARAAAKARRLAEAAHLALHIQSATNGRTSHFYDTTGQQIRGWHKRIPFVSQPQHPLVTRYS